MNDATVLVVDDDRANLESVAAVLFNTNPSRPCRRCSSGKEALDALAGDRRSAF